MLLRFAVANHTSLRDRQELSVLALDDREDVALQRAPTLADKVLPVLGIFGANASGKSNVVDAIRFMAATVVESHQRWTPGAPIRRAPFALDEESRHRPSEFSVDFILDGVRYAYGFACTAARFTEEWLYSYPEGRPRLAFQRDGDEIKFGSSLGGQRRLIAKVMRPNSLYLSAAAANNHEQLAAVYEWFRSGIIVATDFNTMPRIAATAHMHEDPATRRRVLDLLQYADLGIGSISVREEEFPLEARKHLIQAFRLMNMANFETPDVDDTEFFIPRIELGHTVGKRDYTLPIEAESSGTVTWLGMVGPILDALDRGRTLVVDELNARLHPYLAGHLVKLFQDSATNTHGAQLIFNSHDPTILGSYGPTRLHRDQIWLTEKSDDGASRLFPLTEFRVRDGIDNIERGYLLGRYGALPFVDETRLESVVADK